MLSTGFAVVVLGLGCLLSYQRANQWLLIEEVEGCGELRVRSGPIIRAVGTEAKDCVLATRVARQYVGHYVLVAAEGCILEHRASNCFQWACRWNSSNGAEYAAEIDTAPRCYGSSDRVAGFIGMSGRDLGIELVSSGAASVGVECESDEGYCAQMRRGSMGESSRQDRQENRTDTSDPE